MILNPMIRSNICLNSHPAGCVKSVNDQIAYVKKTFKGAPPAQTPKLILVIGCSTGYGLASRIAGAFGYQAATLGLSFEKEGTATKPGTPGFYNNMAFDKAAKDEGLWSKTINGDAFSNEAKTRVIDIIKDGKANGLPASKIDLIIYSLASPVRTDPKTGIMHKSVIKPIGKAFSGDTIDMMTGAIMNISAEPAGEDEIANTVKVMGGEDWELWIEALSAAGVLADGFRTVAYTYIGPELSWAIYKNGTIGKAKEDLERAGRAINQKQGKRCAWVSVNKAVVTRASAVIPIIPFYIACLFRVMKDAGLHEGCIEQITRLYRERLWTAEAAAAPEKIPVDDAGRIRIDDWEMRDDIQKAVREKMDRIRQAGQDAGSKLLTESDIAGFKHDFLEAHGFDVAGIDYTKEVATDRIEI